MPNEIGNAMLLLLYNFEEEEAYGWKLNLPREMAKFYFGVLKKSSCLPDFQGVENALENGTAFVRSINFSGKPKNNSWLGVETNQNFEPFAVRNLG